MLPYSPIAGGILSGKYNNGFIPENSRFSDYIGHPTKRIRVHAKRFYNEKTLNATAEFIEIAKKYDLSPVTLAVAYSKQFDFVASTIIGARNAAQLDDSLKAADLRLSREIMLDLKRLRERHLYPMG